MKPKIEFEQTKTDEEMFLGGLPVKLNKKLESGNSLKDTLTLKIKSELEDTLTSQDALVKSIEQINKKYRGYRAKKSYPYPKAANQAIPATLWLIETILVRVFDVIFGQKKAFLFKAKKPEFMEVASGLEDAMDWWAKNVGNLEKALFSPIMQALKVGTGIVKLDYVRKKRTVVMRATDEDILDPETQIYKDKDGNSLVKKPITSFDGVVLRPIDRADFFISPEATSIDDAEMVGFNFLDSHASLKRKAAQKVYDKKAVEAIIKASGAESTEVQQSRSELQGKDVPSELKDREWIQEIYYRFDCDEDGEPDDILIHFHRRTGQILMVLYNQYFYGFRPLVDLVAYREEYSFDGYGGCLRVESMQDELDAIHNQNLDRANQINSPMYKLYTGGIENENYDIYPGKVWMCSSPEHNFETIEWATGYTSRADEEQLINFYMEKTLGVTPDTMGVPTTERPVFRDTASRLQESSKKFKFLINNLFRGINDIGKKVVMMYSQYQPSWEYQTEGSGDEPVLRYETTDFPQEYLWDCVDICLSASKEDINVDLRREKNLQLYELLGDYFTKLTGMAQFAVAPNVPLSLRSFILEVAGVSAKLMKKIVDDTDTVDSDDIVLDMRKSLDMDELVQAALMTQAQSQGPQEGSEMPVEGQQGPTQPMQ